MEKETGCSGKLLRVSISGFAGMAIVPESLLSTLIFVMIVVSISEACMLNSPFLISKRKLSRMGKVFEEFKTPLMAFSCFNKVEVETTKFIDVKFETQN
jgi:hypothetical protein